MRAWIAMKVTSNLKSDIMEKVFHRFTHFSVCKIPQAGIILSEGFDNVPWCSTASAHECMATHFYFDILVNLNKGLSRHCPDPCREQKY